MLDLEHILNFIEKDCPADTYLTADIPVQEFTIEIAAFPKKSLEALGSYGFVRNVYFESEEGGFCFGIVVHIATDGLKVERLV